MVIELFIKNKVNNKIYKPVCIGDITLTSRLKGSASVLSFVVKKDSVISFHEGDEVLFRIDYKNVFKGYVFEKNRRDGKAINVKCYDFLRYLKYEDCLTIGGMPTSGLIKFLGQINEWKLGEIEDTKFNLPPIVMDDSAYIDVIQKSIDETYDYTFEEFVLFVKNGELTLKNVKNMKTDFVLTENNCCGFDYTSSIDQDTYNQIKIAQRRSDDKFAEVKVVRDEENINRWGRLQYVEVIGENDIIKEHQASQLLKKHNRVTRRLTFSNVFGRDDIRAGCQIFIKFNLGDVVLNDFFVVESCTHRINEDIHFMDVNVRSVTLDGLI